MTDVARIRREIAIELDEMAAAGTGEDNSPYVPDALDPELNEVFRDEGLSDAAIEWLIASASDAALPPEFARVSVERILSTATTSIPDLRKLRESRGISIARARAMLNGIAPAFFERLEEGPGLRWLRVRAESVGAYVDALGIPRGAFVRAMSLAIRSYSGEHPWGYRPGAVAERPVDPTDETAVLPEAAEWATSLLSGENAPSPIEPESRELFGFSWSPGDVHRQSRPLTRAAHRAILREEMLTERDVDWEALTSSADELLILLTDVGRRLPAFQFDRERPAVKPLVAEINAKLGAATDPWGTASWWFTPSGYLGGRPVDLLSSPDAADRLRSAVQFLDADPG
jgi:hypothetical protein